MLSERYVYVLVYRVHVTQRIDWNQPTGGLVIELADLQQKPSLRYDLAHERYHCGPGERLVMVEAMQVSTQRLAAQLHHEWECDVLKFVWLMEDICK
jgi:hypothetical protein